MKGSGKMSKKKNAAFETPEEKPEEKQAEMLEELQKMRAEAENKL